MPLTPFQSALARALAGNRGPDSYLAGGAALHRAPNSKRYSNDLDFFHDSEARVAEAFAADREVLEAADYQLEIEVSQPGYLRALVTRDAEETLVEWAHDSAWRFMPTVEDDELGYRLHDIDLAINKVLALVGRDEARDFLDVLHAHDEILPLGALCWAAAGKDPGYTPLTLLDLLRRRGKYHKADFDRLHLAHPVVLTELKERWLAALADADAFVRSRPPDEVGCLYYSAASEGFVQPGPGDTEAVPHYGRPGGVVPSVRQPSEL